MDTMQENTLGEGLWKRLYCFTGLVLKVAISSEGLSRDAETCLCTPELMHTKTYNVGCQPSSPRGDC